MCRECEIDFRNNLTKQGYSKDVIIELIEFFEGVCDTDCDNCILNNEGDNE